MSIPFYYVKLRTGVEANRMSIIPLAGEPIYTTDTKMIYVGDGVTPGGIPLKAEPTNFAFEYSTYNFFLDDTENRDIELTTWKQVVNVIKFSKTYNNTVWFNFSIPQFWRNNKDAYLEIQYILGSGQYSKIVKLDFSYYVVTVGRTVEYDNPDYESTYRILSTTSNIDKYAREVIEDFKISAAHLTNQDNLLIVGKLRRNAENSLDDFDGTFLLSRLIIKQIE